MQGCNVMSVSVSPTLTVPMAALCIEITDLELMGLCPTPAVRKPASVAPRSPHLCWRKKDRKRINQSCLIGFLSRDSPVWTQRGELL